MTGWFIEIFLKNRKVGTMLPTFFIDDFIKHLKKGVKKSM